MLQHISPTPVGLQHNGMTVGEVMDKAGYMAPLNYLRLSRVALFARIACDQSQLVLALLHCTAQAPRSWLMAVIVDLEFISTCFSTCRDMAAASLPRWIAFFVASRRRAMVWNTKALSVLGCNCISRQALEHHTANDDYYGCSVCGGVWATRQQLGGTCRTAPQFVKCVWLENTLAMAWRKTTQFVEQAL